MLFLLACSAGNGLDEFRKPELESIARLHNFRLEFADEHAAGTRPYVVVDLDSEREAKLLGARAISVKHVWHYWADAATYEELHETIKTRKDLWQHFAESRTTSWRFYVSAFGRTIPQKDQRAVIETFSYMAFVGDINLKTPDVTLGVFEEYEHALVQQERGRDFKDLQRVWMGRKICDSARYLVDQFDLKKRKYIGTTSMEAEVSFYMAAQALASPGKICYDPFAGTGSMLLTAAALGAYAFGSDIDGRQMRGKGTSIRDSAKQYNVADRLVDCCTFDMTQHPFRTGELFDAIVTDPPYGVRAGAKRLGRKPGAREVPPTLVPGRENEGFHHQLPGYVPPSVPWEMSSVINSVISYSLFMLKPGGRLVFFLPTNNEEYRDVDIPQVPGMRLVANSSQDFGKWARRLITMEKLETGWQNIVRGLDRGIEREGTETVEERPRKVDLSGRGEAEERKPGHYGFRQWYFDERKQRDA